MRLLLRGISSATPNNAGFRVEEERGLEPIDRGASAPRARRSSGRSLRGPVNRPVLLRNFAEFQHTFGGLWQPSTLAYAVEHFFDNGGREALVVRVVNGARAATLTLRAGTQTLQLRAVRPGTREFLRASVDYDRRIARQLGGLQPDRTARARGRGTEQVEDQEIFARVSLLPDGGPVPRGRAARVGADRTRGRDAGAASRPDSRFGERPCHALCQFERRRATMARR